MTDPRRAGQIDAAGIITLAALATWLLIGDFQVRLANISTDDGLVAYALYRLDPERFRLDEQMHIWVQSAGVSMLNWLPALLATRLGINPEAIALVAVYAQNLLLALAVFRFARVATGSRAVAWVSTLFILSARPHWWNLALYGDLDWMPYAGWMALPFLVLAATFALERRLWAAAMSVLIGGLFHQILGLGAAGTLAVFQLIEWRSEGNGRVALKGGALLGLAVLAFAIPAMVAMQGGMQVSAERLLASISKNGHAAPWLSGSGCAYCRGLFIHNCIAMAAFLAITAAFLRKGSCDRRVRSLMITVTLVALLGVGIHVAAWALDEPRIMRLIGSRVTMLLMILATPFVVAEALDKMAGSRWFDRLLAGYLLLLPAAAPVAAAALAWSAPDRRPAFIRVVRIAGIALFAVILMRHIPVVQTIGDKILLAAGVSTGLLPVLFRFETGARGLLPLTMLAWIVTALTICGALCRRRSVSPITCAAWAMALPLAGYLLVANYRLGIAAAAGEAGAYRDVQLWARQSTPPRAAFAITGMTTYNAWRNLSQRAVIPDGVGGFYLFTARGDAYNARLSDFYAQLGKSRFEQLNASELNLFGAAFGADYAVRRAEWPALELPEAYRNSHFVVYRLR